MKLMDRKNVREWKEGSLVGKVIVIKESWFTPKYKEAKYQLAVAAGGFGCELYTGGSAVYVVECIDGEKMRISFGDVLGIATEETIAEWKKDYGEFVEAAVKTIK